MVNREGPSGGAKPASSRLCEGDDPAYRVGRSPFPLEDAVTGDAGRPIEPGPTESSGSRLARWAAVVIVGEICLVVLVFALATLRIDQPLTYVGAIAVATLIGGRVGGVRGVAQWILAAVLILVVALALLYLAIVVVLSQLTGP